MAIVKPFVCIRPVEALAAQVAALPYDVYNRKAVSYTHLILSAAMMLRYSFDMDKEAEAIETAVQQVLTEGYRTGDIYSEGCKKVGTIQMGDLIADRIHA